MVKDWSSSVETTSLRPASWMSASDFTVPVPVANQSLIWMLTGIEAVLQAMVISTMVAVNVPAGTVTVAVPAPWTVMCAVSFRCLPFSVNLSVRTDLLAEGVAEGNAGKRVPQLRAVFAGGGQRQA